MGQLIGCVRGIGEACRVLDFPVVSGNVSLYNETNGRAILPTPTIGGVGVLDDFTRSATLAFKAADEAILVLGDTRGWLGQSLYLREICEREEGAPPPVDLDAERRNGDFVRALIDEQIATAVHDVSDGGLAVALAEMAMASGIGATIPGLTGTDPIPVWFGEDQGRYLLTLSIDPQSGEWDRICEEQGKLGIFAPWIGTTGGSTLKLGDARAIPVSELKAAHEGWFPRFMDQAS
jgi:phosphoribosylformylglycinamidine synthase